MVIKSLLCNSVLQAKNQGVPPPMLPGTSGLAEV
jgi:hypothetical protein